MYDNDISDVFTRSFNIWLLHSSYIAVTRSYIWYVTVIHNVFTIYVRMYIHTHIYVYIYIYTYKLWVYISKYYKIIKIVLHCNWFNRFLKTQHSLVVIFYSNISFYVYMDVFIRIDAFGKTDIKWLLQQIWHTSVYIPNQLVSYSIWSQLRLTTKCMTKYYKI